MEDNKTQEEQQKPELELDKENSYWKTLKRLKLATFLFVGLIALALSLNFGVHATSTSTFCASCHMMAPQALTWEVSSHSSVECKDCHIAPGLQNTVDAKIGGLRELYHTVTDSYVAPIRMPSLIPNESCLKCHNMSNRNVTASGDIIIDHNIHEEKEISCVTCHDGVAHGKISELRVTYKSDYTRWDSQVAERFMADTKYTRPQMDKCMDCHELRKAPLTCETCHSTEMIPDDHKEESFVKGEHGRIASDELMYCESCHSYMSDQPIKEFKEEAHYRKFISSDSVERKLTVQEYAKTNTFCVTCHSIRPDSHSSTLFFNNHGKHTTTNSTCFTCHDNKIRSDSPVTNITCASCHPSKHNSGAWKVKHPVALPEQPKFERSCLNCHVEETCTRCHAQGNRDTQKSIKEEDVDEDE